MDSNYRVVPIAYLGFVALALPGAVLGPLWTPYMQQGFEQPVAALGALLLTTALGYFTGSVFSGTLFSRFPAGPLLSAAMLLSAAGFAGYILAPAWLWVVILGLVTGLGTSLIDGGMNIYFAAHFDARLMNWLHACFGLGSLLAPQLVNVVVVRGQADWRWVYICLIGLYLLLAAAFALTRTWWRPAVAATDGGQAVSVPFTATLSLPVVWLGVFIFATIAGVEIGAGTWAPAFFQGRGMSVEGANNWVTAYWASFTVGRIFFGFIVNQFSSRAIIQFCLVGAIFGTALLWFAGTLIGALGLVLVGFMMAPIFALLITETQERLGIHAPNAIGFQVAAASVGSGALLAVMGVFIQQFGVGVLPVFLAGVLAAMFVLYQLHQAQRAPELAPTLR